MRLGCEDTPELQMSRGQSGHNTGEVTGTGKGSPGEERSHGNQHGRGWLTVTNSMTSCQGGPRIKLKAAAYRRQAYLPVG